MTDLQLGLLALGVAAVAGVLLYNRLQERAVRREAKRNFAVQPPDVLSGEPAQRREPTERREPTLEPLPPRPPTPPENRPDPRIDYIAELRGVPPGALAQRLAGRALLYEAPGGLQAGLQMVSRRGVIAEAELVDFRSHMETLAASHGGTVSAPEVRAALEVAGEVDRACAEVDIQIALHVVGAARNPAGEDQPFKVTQRPGGVTFLLDVPRTADLPRSYEAMVAAARELGGRLVDDNGNALDERALAAIRAELEATRARLAALGIEPGSPLALRLFS
jgi:hypothetical protein